MKRTLKLTLLLLILIIALLSTVSCEIIDLFRDKRHICSFSDSRVVSEHSCTTDGIIISSCICGRESTDITPAIGHRFGDWEITRNADCTTIGREERICSECGETESREIPKDAHSYEISGEQVGEVMFNRYVCLECGDSFSIDSGIQIPPEENGARLLYDLEKDFSFTIISVGDEEYIRKNLSIFELASYRSGECDYTLTDLGEGRWRVTPSPEYASGKSYIAERDGGIFFTDFGNRSLIFTIIDEKINEITLNPDVIYIAALEEENPGYYPFSIEFSDGSGGVFLSLERSDGLKVGDLICVGGAKSEADVLSGIGSNLFGRIKSITKLTDGRSLLMLDAENMADLLPSLDVYLDEPINAEALRPIAGHEAKLLATLLADGDFLALTDAFYKAAGELLASRGLTTEYKSAEDMISAITTSGLRKAELLPDENGRLTLYAIAETRVKLSVPARLGNRLVGEISSEISFSTELTNGKVKLQLERNGYMSLDVSEDLRSTLKLETYTNIDYTADQEIFLYEAESKLYHLPACEKISARTTKLTIPELMQVENPTECEHCQPLALLKSLLVSDGKYLHTVLCRKLPTDDKTVFTETDPHRFITEETLLPCPDCMEKAEIRSAIRESLTEILSEIEVGETEGEPKLMTLGVFATSVSGLDRQVFSLTMDLDFTLPTEAKYEIISESHSSFSYRIFDGKIVRYVEGNTEGSPLCELEFYLLGFKVKYE